MSLRIPLICGILACLLVACSPCTRDILGPYSFVTRSESLAISSAYTEMTWKGKADNIRHGLDPDGIRIDTPDAVSPNPLRGSWWRPGTLSRGMPYKWGGFDTPRQFAERLTQSVPSGSIPTAAGDMGTADKQKAGDNAVSRFAAGIDCSGFISRCWRLDRPYSTRELPKLCNPLFSWEELQPGDILIIPGQHVLMFIAWDTKDHSGFTAREAGPLPVWKCAEHSLNTSYLQSLGYRPMRYRNMVNTSPSI